MTTNETEKFGISKEQVDALFERSAAEAVAKREARRRAAEWPGYVEDTLVALAHGSQAHREALAAIDARLTRLEATLGIGEG